MPKTSPARRVATAVACVLTVVCGYYAAVYALAALSPDGTAYDVVGAVALMLATCGLGSLAWGGLR
jgi:hypothetical protein